MLIPIKSLALSALLLFLFGFLAGCAANSNYLKPTQVLLSTDRSTSQIFSDLRTKLGKYKYKIALEDRSVGLLVSEPRQFSLDHNGQKIEAQQTVQIRQEGGSVKVRLSYACDYTGDRKFTPCLADDPEDNQKISRLNRGLIRLVTQALKNPATR